MKVTRKDIREGWKLTKEKLIAMIYTLVAICFVFGPIVATAFFGPVCALAYVVTVPLGIFVYNVSEAYEARKRREYKELLKAHKTERED